MKYLRILLAGLGFVTVFVVIVALLAFVPAVQTWVAREEIGGLPGMQVALGSVTAGWNTVEVTDLRVEKDGATLIAPKIQAALPVKTAVWDRRFIVRQITAKGWTLDLTRTSQTGAEAGSAGPATPADDMGEAVLNPGQAARFAERMVKRVVRGVLSQWRLPVAGSLDDADLEGDVLVPGRDGTPPGRIHLIVKGGGLAAGRDASFAVDTTLALVTPGPAISHVALHGHLQATLDPDLKLNRIGWQSDVSAAGGSLPQNVSWTVDAALRHRSDAVEDYTLDVRDGTRHLVSAKGSYSRATHRIAGGWKVDLHDSDVTAFRLNIPPAGMAATGEGQFDTDSGGQTVHVAGWLDVVSDRPGAIVPQLQGAGPLKLGAQFDVNRSGRTWRIDRLDTSLADDRPIMEWHGLQPFVFDEGRRTIEAANPKKDWMRISISNVPLRWFAGATDRLEFTGGFLKGGFVVRAAEGGFFLRQTAPLTATDVALRSHGVSLGNGLGLSLSVSGDYAPTGWHAEVAPFSVDASGRQVAIVEARLSGSGGADRTAKVDGTWKADLDALASVAAAPGLRWIRGRTASGSFAGQLGKTSEVTGQFAVTGHDPARTLTAKIQADIDGEGAVDFQIPAQIKFGRKTSDLNAEGNWTSADGDDDIALRLSGENVIFDHVRLVLASLAEWAGAGPFGTDIGTKDEPHGPPDLTPFWGNWVGSLSLDFKRLKIRDQDYFNVGGVLNFDHDSVKSIGGHFGLSPKTLAKIGGSIAFDADARLPYTIAAQAECAEVDPALLFPKPKDEEYPPVEGKFAATETLSGRGANWADLVNHVREEFRVTSKAGIVRLLKSDVAQSMPEERDSHVGDALGAAGSFVGWLAGVKKGSVVSGAKKVPKTEEAVLDFADDIAEIGYDSVTIVAHHEADGTIRLDTIEMTAPEEHVTGSGEITYRRNAPLRSRPISVDLNLGARGSVAGLLTKAGLLSSKKDSLGYTLLDRPIHFGGTLERIDQSAWRDLLRAAALRKPDVAKKGG